MVGRRAFAALGASAVVACFASSGAVPAAAIEPRAAAQELFSLTNLDRTSNGLSALARDSRLTTMAFARSEDMITRGYFSHEIPPRGLTVVDLLESLGVPFIAAGENIAWNNAIDFATVQSAGSDFINSPRHREVLMDDRWDRMGAGVADGGGKKMYTVVFMQTVPAGQALGAPARGASGGGRAATAQRVIGEHVEATGARSGLLTSLVNTLVRLFLGL